MEKNPQTKKPEEQAELPAPPTPEVATQSPESYEIPAEDLAELRERVEWQFKHASGSSGIRRGIEIRRGMLESITEPATRAERQAELGLMEQLYADMQMARQKLWRKLEMASVALFIAFAPAQDSKMPTPEYGQGAYAERHVAAEELERDGITAYQKSAHINGLSEILARGFAPFGYSSDRGGETDLVRGIGGVITGVVYDKNKDIEDFYSKLAEEGSNDANREEFKHRTQIIRNRMDAWRLYLGLPQKNNTFGISEYKPEKSKEDRYYYKINAYQKAYEPVEVGGIKAVPVKSLIEFIKKNAKEGANKVMPEDQAFGIMGRYTLSMGQDEKGPYISYWDRWDLDRSFEGKVGRIGKPYEIYDRIHYDPKTFEIIEGKK